MNKLKNGFTLVELLIAITVGMIIMAAIYAMINLAQKSSGNVGRRVLTQQDSRAVLDLMAMEISMASFNPKMNNDNATWNGNMLDNCNTIAMTQARRGIQVATDTQIGVAMDLGGFINVTTGVNEPSGFIADDPNEYIMYTYNDSTNAINDKKNTISRRVNCGNDEIILGGARSSTMIRNDPTAGTPLFQYFDIAGTDISAAVIDTATADANILLIRRIRINIIADVEHEEKRGTLKVSRRTYTTDVLVRNHAF